MGIGKTIKEFTSKIFSVPYGTTSQIIQNPYYTERYNFQKWVELGIPSDQTGGFRNAYYDYLISLYSRSITHAKLIDIKSDMTYGGGFENIPNELKYLNKILKSQTHDLNLLGSVSLKITWDRKSLIDPTYAKPAKIEYIPTKNIRIGNPFNEKTKDKYYVCNDWTSFENKSNSSKVLEIHKFSLDFNDRKNHPVQIYYNPFRIVGNAVYGMPLYGYQTDIFEIAYEIPKFHITGLKRGAFANLHVHNSNGIGTEELQRQFIEGFNDLYTGTQGPRTYFTFGQDEQHKVELNPIDLGISDQKFLSLWEKNTEAIFEAHGVDMELLTGKKDGVSIGREDILEIIEKTQVKNINQLQLFLEDMYNEIYSMSGLNYEFKIKKYEINLRKVKTSTQDIMMILSSQVPNNVKLELLKDAGVQNPERFINGLNDTNLPVEQPVENQPQEMSSNINTTLTNLSGKQQQNIERITRKYLKGTYTKSQAALLMTNGFGLTSEEAINWLEDAEKSASSENE